MKRLFILLYACLVIALSCRQNYTETDYIKAEVASPKDISCAVPLLSFEEDSVKIRRVTKEKSLVYGVAGLPDSMRIANKKLYVLIKKIAPENEFICNTLGIAYPHLEVIDVKVR